MSLQGPLTLTTRARAGGQLGPGLQQEGPPSWATWGAGLFLSGFGEEAQIPFVCLKICLKGPGGIIPEGIFSSLHMSAFPMSRKQLRKEHF